MAVYPVILVGAGGARLWPCPGPSSPKQFSPLIGPRSTFQSTAMRAAELDGFAELIVVTADKHLDFVAEQLESLEVARRIVIEPERRDTLAALAAAAAFVHQIDPLAMLVALCASQDVPDRGAFQRAVRRAVAASRDGRLVLLGAQPTSATTAYGYLKAGEQAGDGSGVRKVECFVQNPDETQAAVFVREGRLWHTGNFAFSAATLLRECDVHEPQIAAAVRSAVDRPANAGEPLYRLGDAFRAAPKVSVSSLIARSSCATVLPVDFEWSDLGAWDTVKAACGSDGLGNTVHGEAVLIETQGCLIRAADTMFVGTIGVQNLAIVVEENSVLVAALPQSRKVESLVDVMKANNRLQLPRHKQAGNERGPQGLKARTRIQGVRAGTGRRIIDGELGANELSLTFDTGGSEAERVVFTPAAAAQLRKLLDRQGF